MHALEAHNLTKMYRRQHLGRTAVTRGVEGVSFSVDPGTVFGLLGLNGSGKTTTIKLLLGLLRPTAGTVSVFGEPVPSPAVLRNIGYLPEVPYFYRYLTAREILSFYGRLSELSDVPKKTAAALDLVGLTAWADKRLAEFSKGMLQRVGLAQSLLHDPALLIYDEPVSGLDPLAMQEMRDLILRLKARGKTVFLSSHHIAELEKICDNVGILAAGSLVRVIGRAAWAAAPGTLEQLFVADVAATSAMGRITW